MHLALVNVGHWYEPDRVLFHGLTEEIGSGHLCAVVGPSGSGKSTLLALMAGWEAPREGQVDRDGLISTQWVFQNPHGVAGRTALDHVAFVYVAAGLARGAAEGRAMDLLTRFRIDSVAAKPFAALSGGEAQRLMLARGLAAEPDLLLVDEPTAQLDRLAASDVSRVLTELGADNHIVVIATHDPAIWNACEQIIDLGAESAS